MHAARLESSPRLQRALAFMREGCWRSTREISRGADVCAVNDVILELEKNGYTFERKREGHRWYYRLSDPVQLELVA